MIIEVAILIIFLLSEVAPMSTIIIAAAIVQRLKNKDRDADELC